MCRPQLNRLTHPPSISNFRSADPDVGCVSEKEEVGTMRKSISLASVITIILCCLSEAKPGQEPNDQSLPAASATLFYAFPYDGVGASGYSHGKIPYSELIQGADGNYYGTTTEGGDSSCSDGFGLEGCGTIFKITPGGVETVLFQFTYDSTTNTAVNGIYPYGGMVQARDGNFYGTTAYGGNPAAGCILGCGVVFKITPAGKFTLLHQFAGLSSNPAEGAVPTGRLIQAIDGKLYGTTTAGGAVQAYYNQGTIFSITTSGAFTTLHQFDNIHGVTDGVNPYAGLVQGKDGNFYGTTYFGGTTNTGTVFKFSKTGSMTVLHSFVETSHLVYPDGAFLQGALVQGTDGNLYGTATQGGVASGSYGTLFEVTTNGKFTNLYDFNPTTGSVFGYYPVAGVIQASDGNFYGTTEYGGPSGCDCGTVFEMSVTGIVSQIAQFDDANTGRWPISAALQAADGTLFVTNAKGPSIGSHDPGTIMQINNGLSKPKPTIIGFAPTSGKVGQNITILGTHFVGTTGVSFNGTAAKFAVKSTAIVVTVVPPGASSGRITVTNAGGSAISVGSFTVLP